MRKLDEDSYIAPLFLVGVFLISLTYFIVRAAIWRYKSYQKPLPKNSMNEYIITKLNKKSGKVFARPVRTYDQSEVMTEDVFGDKDVLDLNTLDEGSVWNESRDSSNAGSRIGKTENSKSLVIDIASKN